MPELPEVETTVRSVAPRLEGRRIRSARFSSRFVLRQDPEETAAQLKGRRILTVRRHGKFIVAELSGGQCLSIHLGMTGRLLWNGVEGPYTRAVFELDRGRLIYDDPRQFGRIETGCGLPDRVARLGPDALAINEEEFAALLALRRGRIKSLLLNQLFLRGVGNIYADESLFRARIHPLAQAARLAARTRTPAVRGLAGSAADRHRARRLLHFGLRGRGRQEGLVPDLPPRLRPRGRAVRGMRRAHPAHPGGAARNALLPQVPARLSGYSAAAAAAAS